MIGFLLLIKKKKMIGFPTLYECTLFLGQQQGESMKLCLMADLIV
jgi:hypothetical protein